MSIEWQTNLFGYGLIALVFFVGAVLVLEQDGRHPYRDLTDRERVWVGRAGLAAPLWPIIVLAVLVSLIVYLLRTLINAARGRG